MAESTEPSVWERILLLQNSLQETVDEKRLAEVLARGIADIPGVDGVAVCLEGAARGAGSYRERARSLCDRRAAGNDAGQNFRKFELRTHQHEYGTLIVDVADAEALAPYLPFIDNTANHAALHIENTRNTKALEDSNLTLAAKVRAYTAELRKSKQRMELALRGADLGTWDWNVATGEVTFNERWAEMIGYRHDEIKPHASAWEELVHPDDFPEVKRSLELHLEGKTEVYETEHRLKHKSGDWVWVLDKGRVIERDAGGTPLRACGTHLNITERKQSEEKRKLSEERFRSLFEQTAVGCYLIEPTAPVPVESPPLDQIKRIYHGTIIECNDAQARMYSYSKKEQIIGRPASEFHGDRGNLENVDFLRAWIEQGYHITGALSSEVDRLGKRLWFSNNVTGIVEDGMLVRVWGTQIDVTKMKQAEEAVARERNLSDVIIDSLPGLFYLFDQEGRFLRWNRAFEEITGYGAEEIPQLHPLDIFRGDERELVAERIRKVFDTGQNSVEALLASKDGRTTPYFFTGRRIEYNERSCLIGMGIDITERKQAEHDREILQAQLIQAQRIEAIGRLAGGIAHEFNNMLNVIHGNAQLLGLRLDQKSPLHKFVREITSAAERSAQMTGQLLTYARKQMHTPRVIDINEVIGEYKWLLQRLIGEAVEMRFHPGQGIWPVRIDPSQLDHILTNLTTNARDAIAGTGSVTISTENVRFDRYTAPADLSPGDYVRLAFSDSGVGMDDVTRQRLFEPYFTTKDVGKGTGLGLATVYGVVKQNNGGIELWSRPGEGTTFQIYFPRSGEEASAEQPQVETIVSGKGETVLVVEDEQQVLELTETILQSTGYTVLKAATPGAAIAIAKERRERIDLLVTDVVLPEMNGREMRERIEAFRPGITTLFMSGYNEDVVSGNELTAEATGFIRKPFTVQSLSRKVRDMLDR